MYTGMIVHMPVIKFFIQSFFLIFLGKVPLEVDVNDLSKGPILPKTTELPPTLLPKMKQNIIDSHLISQHQRKLPTRVKQNSDSRLVKIQHEQHDHTILPLECVQATTLSQCQALKLSDSK